MRSVATATPRPAAGVASAGPLRVASLAAVPAGPSTAKALSSHALSVAGAMQYPQLFFAAAGTPRRKRRPRRRPGGRGSAAGPGDPLAVFAPRGAPRRRRSRVLSQPTAVRDSARGSRAMDAVPTPLPRLVCNVRRSPESADRPRPRRTMTRLTRIDWCRHRRTGSHRRPLPSSPVRTAATQCLARCLGTVPRVREPPAPRTAGRAPDTWTAAQLPRWQHRARPAYTGNSTVSESRAGRLTGALPAPRATYKPPRTARPQAPAFVFW